MLRKIVSYHVLPILTAICLSILVLFILSSTLSSSTSSTTVNIHGKQEKTRSFHPNLSNGDQAEIDFIGSIKNPNQLTILGSSEFSDSPYASYNFLPDSLGIQAMGVGHAFHQELSMICELLAANEHLENSKICIVFSVGWLNTQGTNIEAFIEFVRPNFLNKIAYDPNIEDKYKNHVGEYIHNNYSLINGASHSMNSLREQYLNSEGGIISTIEESIRKALMKHTKKTPTSYSVSLVADSLTQSWNGDYKSSLIRLQNEFVGAIHDNDIYVNDVYFNTHLLNEDGTHKTTYIPTIDLEHNQEFKDFNMLVNLLVEKNVQASFIIQPLNPYYYQDLKDNSHTVKAVTKILDKHHIPYLNMFVTTKKEYAPGTLKDVMHLGDYGWMQINQFLQSVYHE